MPLNWNISPADAFLVAQIVDRADVLLDLPAGRSNLTLDLTTVHLNTCPLDLARLLHAGERDFRHDVEGIRRHIDRSTGRLLRRFVPRYTLEVRA